MNNTALPTLEIPDLTRPRDDTAVSLLRDWPAEELLRANLTVLREKNEKLAECIAGIEVPSSYRMVVAQDGSVTFRRIEDNGRKQWLSFTSMPLVTAEANLKRTDIGSGNIAMNGIGSGAYALAILGAMSPYQGLIVFEREALNLNLVFRLRDFTSTLRSGQLVLLCGDDMDALLADFYSANPGYNSIDKAVSWTWLSDQENQRFSQQVGGALEGVLHRVMAEVDTMFARQQQRDKQTPLSDTCKSFVLSESGACPSLRAINCTNVYAPADITVSRDVLSGLAGLGAQTDQQVLNRPDIVSHYAQLKRLNENEPDLIILVDKLRRDVTTLLPESAVCATFVQDGPPSMVEEPFNPNARMGPHDFIFYPRDELREQLIEAKLPAERLAYLAPAVNEEIYRPVE
ncbi:MAG: hypothetical protein JW860_02375, partial [Sedimentisphaerales bacterium]|nr:hypothetical protein [Sedimentisphaerales bacterium]